MKEAICPYCENGQYTRVVKTKYLIPVYQGYPGKCDDISIYRRTLPKTKARLRAESIIGPKGEKLDGDEWERAVAAVERELG